MAKRDESEYFRRIGEEGRQHASRKPYSDPRCGAYFLDMGMILSLLPPPPARILDLGVGTGWTSIFLANRGYSVIGQDISPEGIELANQGKAKTDLGNLDFIVSDYEQMKFSSEFDGAVFYDCLHHSEDTREALSSVYRALRPGGLCVTIEPGTGHAAAQVSTAAAQQWGVTEKDMPPKTIIALATQIGFRKHQVYIRMTDPIKIPSPSSIRDNLNIVKRFLGCFPIVARNNSHVVVLSK